MGPIVGNQATSYILTVCEHINEQRLRELQDLGLSKAQIDAFRTVTVCELLALSKRPPAASPPDALLHYVRLVRSQQQRLALMFELAAVDTPRAEMRRLYALSYDEYKYLRALCGLTAQRGSRQKPTADELERVRRACRTLDLAVDAARQLHPGDYLALVRETGLTVRRILRVLDALLGVNAREPPGDGSRQRAGAKAAHLPLADKLR